MLDALAPGRIDMGSGPRAGLRRPHRLRAQPGGQRAARALPADVRDLMAWVQNEPLVNGHPFAAVKAFPQGATSPEVWILGSSDYGAQVAALFGLPYCYAWFFSDGAGGERAIDLYKRTYRPSERHPTPHSGLCVWALAAPSHGRGAVPPHLARAVAHQPRPRPRWDRWSSPDEAAKMLAPHDQARIEKIRRDIFVGTGPEVMDRIVELKERVGVDEMAVVTWTYDEAVRHQSYAGWPRRSNRQGRCVPVFLGDSMTQTLFTNANLVLDGFTELQPSFNVLVKDNRIARYRAADQRRQATGSSTSAGRTLMPGLIDAHAHITGLSLTPEEHRLSGRGNRHRVGQLPAQLPDGRLHDHAREAGGADHATAPLARRRAHHRGRGCFYSGKALTQTGSAAPTSGRPTRRSIPAAISGRSPTCRRSPTVSPRCARRPARSCARAPPKSSCSPRAAWCPAEEAMRRATRPSDEGTGGHGRGGRRPRHLRDGACLYRSRACGAASKRACAPSEHANFVDRRTVALMADHHGAFCMPTFISLVQRVSAAETPAGHHRRQPAAHDRTRQTGLWLGCKHKVPVGFGTELWGPDRAESPAARNRDAPGDGHAG